MGMIRDNAWRAECLGHVNLGDPGVRLGGADERHERRAVERVVVDVGPTCRQQRAIFNPGDSRPEDRHGAEGSAASAGGGGGGRRLAAFMTR